jgi:NADPH-dependent 2,4-dienoyl-CoA reductase/sulfur reductase-like enzyme
MSPSPDGAGVVIVGASLAGLSAAESLRAAGYAGRICVIGDEPHAPYDRPPLSKAVLMGRFPAAHVTLPRPHTQAGVDWLLGVRATRLDVARRRVHVDDGRAIDFDRVLIATGTRARPWQDEKEARLEGVFTLRGRDDAERLRARLAGAPRRVVVLGGGFTGSEVASCCRELGLPVTLIERGPAPLCGALGTTIAERAAALQRAHGVDLRCGVTATSLRGDAAGRLRRVELSDGNAVDTDVAVVALGAVRNTEWLDDSGLAAGDAGVACDAGCRVFADNLMVTDDVFAAGDVARFPHPLYRHQFLALEHWGNAVEQGTIAAHNMICSPSERWPHLAVPAFWSSQFGVNIKSAGVPSAADEVMIAQGSLEEQRFLAVYGKAGRLVAAVSFNQGRWLPFYVRLIERSAPFPPDVPSADATPTRDAMPAAFPDRASIHQEATAILTGYDANDRRLIWVRQSKPRRRPLEARP